MRVTVLANGKGGCGKTTLATTLASALATSGRRVALADADPQRSSLTWLARRPSNVAPIGSIDWSVAGPATIDAALQIAERSLDWLIVDAPAELLRSSALRTRLAGVLARADSVVAPTTPSPFDAHATRQFLASLEAASCGANGAEILLVGNRMPKKKREAHGLPPQSLAPAAMLSNRGAYRKLADIGLGLFDSEARRHAELRITEWRPLLAALSAPLAAFPAK